MQRAAAREPQKSLNAGTATAQTAVTEPNRSQSPLCPCKAPPNFTIQVPAPSPGNGSRLFVALAIDWFKCDWEDPEVGRPRLTKRSRTGMVSGDNEKVPIHCRRFLPFGSGCAYLTTATP